MLDVTTKEEESHAGRTIAKTPRAAKTTSRISAQMILRRANSTFTEVMDMGAAIPFGGHHMFHSLCCLSLCFYNRRAGEALTRAAVTLKGVQVKHDKLLPTVATVGTKAATFHPEKAGLDIGAIAFKRVLMHTKNGTQVADVHKVNCSACVIHQDRNNETGAVVFCRLVYASNAR